MPFGKYHDIPLRQIDASYFHWLWQKRPLSDSRLEAYIRSRIPALKDENPDLIWD